MHLGLAATEGVQGGPFIIGPSLWNLRIDRLINMFLGHGASWSRGMEARLLQRFHPESSEP